MNNIFEMLMHIDKHLGNLIGDVGPFIYLIMFLIIFSETGFIVTVFLPGDSLVFAAAALSANGSLNPLLMFFVFWIASILGDSLNYKFGSLMREKIINKHKMRFIKTEHIELTHKFYMKHGRMAVIIARFMPVIRAFAPFVAAASDMKYKRFLKYNIIGTFLWTGIFAGLGFFMGKLVEGYFGLIMIGITVVSFLPAVVAFLYTKLKKKQA